MNAFIEEFLSINLFKKEIVKEGDQIEKMHNVDFDDYKVFYLKSDYYNGMLIAYLEEFPALSEMAPTQEEAKKNLRTAFNFRINQLIALGETIPKPGIHWQEETLDSNNSNTIIHEFWSTNEIEN